ncbi:MAG: MFS transporter, partial [Nocardioides sp.]
FWRFWCATVLANIGDGIRMAAFPLLAASLSDQPVVVGLVAAASSLPWLLTGLLAGSLADRHSARLLLVISDAARMAVLVTLVAALLLDRAGIGLVVAAAFALGVGETVRDTTAATVVPRLVPTVLLERANGRMVAGEVAGNEFVGPLIGGGLFALGAALPFVANSAALAVGVLLVLSLPATLLALARPDGDAKSATEPAGMWAGARWLGRHRLLRSLVVSGVFVAVADSAWFAVLVLYARQRLQLGPSGFGVLLAVGAVGGLLGATVAERLIGTGRHRGVLLVSMVLITVPPALLLAVPAWWAAAVVVVVTSAAFGVFNVAAASLRHRLVPQQVLGRVVAAWRTTVLGAGAVGALLGGAVASFSGLGTPFVLSVGLGVVAVAVWWHALRTGPEPPTALAS